MRNNLLRNSQNWLFKYSALVLVVLLVSCGGDDDDDNNDSAPTGLNEVATLSIVDIANDGSASDIQVYIVQNTAGQSVNEHRVILVKSTNSNAFDLSAADNVPVTSYSVLDPEALDQIIGSTLQDVDGDAIAEDVAYKAFVLSVTDEDSPNILSAASNTLTLEQKNAVRNLTVYFPAGSGGMDTDASGNILMGDFGGSISGAPGTKVYKITPQGAVSVFAEGLGGASGNEFDSNGDFYQANIGSSTVSKISSIGTVTTFASSTLQGPVGITFDAEDNMYVCNCGKNDLSKITPAGNAEVFVSNSLFNCPNGITIDDVGNLYVANFGNGDVIKVTPEKKVTRLATIRGGNNGHLVFEKGLLWVVDRSGNAIYTVTTTGVSNGIITKIAGNGTRGNKNGSTNEATFSLPNDLTFSPDGKLIYINDVDPKAAQGNISPVIIRVLELVE